MLFRSPCCQACCPAPLPTDTWVPRELAGCCPLGKGGYARGGQRTSLTAAFPLSVPVKEVLPGIVKQGANCLESQGQDTAGNFLLSMGTCRGSAKSPPAAQVSGLGPPGQDRARVGTSLCPFSSSLCLHLPQTHFPKDPASCPLTLCSLGLLPPYSVAFVACHTVALWAPPAFSLQREKCCPNRARDRKSVV